jgi:hypothetical protein
MIKYTIITSMILLATAIFFAAHSPEEQINPEYTSIFTKEICKDKLCQDHIVTCKNKEIISITPTGLAVQFEHDWKDPRPTEQIDKEC